MICRISAMSAFFALAMACSTAELHESTSGQARNAEEPLEVRVEAGFADVNGTRLYYELAGSGEPIVLIHGNLGDRRHLDAQLEAFAENNRVLRYDVRGFGKSSLPVEGNEYTHHDDLKALLLHVGMPKAHIAGYSMGSAIAVDFALAYPEMCNSLIAIGPCVYGYRSSADKEAQERIFGRIPSMLKEKGAEAVAEHLLSDYPQMKGSARKDSLIAIICDYSFWHFSHEDPARFVDPPAIQRLDQINLPTLIVTAEDDLAPCREVAALMEQELPNSKRIDIPDATHFMHIERPMEFNKAVVEFLSEISGR